MNYRTLIALVIVLVAVVAFVERGPVRSTGSDITDDGRATTGVTAKPWFPSWRHELLGGNAESCAAAAAKSLDDTALVKQLFMVGTSAAAGRSGLAAQPGVGGFLLTGRSSAGVSATAKFTSALSAGMPDSRIKPIVAVDQEGGAVQALTGTGFSRIPAAEVQGTWSAGRLRDSAEKWGSELASAGVSVNLAPVVDLVAADRLKVNMPIGVFHRQLATDPAGVVSSAKAITAGMTSGGLGVVYKHFPGLGAVVENTDYSRRVTDPTTDAASESVNIYRQLLPASGASVMLSTAVYSKLDPNDLAAFSRIVVQRLLREDLHFGGVVISDDLADADQVENVPVKDRAVRLLSAGADLVTAADPRIAAAMFLGVVAAADADANLSAHVRESALRVLTLKASLGLLDCQALTG
jgi:beta-N-acetylhexosaminidase